MLDALAELGGEGKSRDAATVSGVKKASVIMNSNFYGWFEHVSTGVYRVTDAGYNALEEFEETVYVLKKNNKTDA